MASSWQKHLAAQGYTPIRLPSADFDIFTLVYERDGRRGHDNAFDALVKGATGDRPDIRRGLATVNLGGEFKRSFDISLGLNILQGLLSALGGKTLGLNLGFKNASEVTFSYEGVQKDIVSPVELEMFLRTATAPDSGLLSRWLSDHLYVITSTLSAKKIKVSAKSSSGQDVGLDVPVISDAVGGKLKVERSASNTHEIVFEGSDALPFAAQLYRVRRYRKDDPDSMTLRATKPGGVVVKSMANKSFETEPLDEIDLIIPDVLEGEIGTIDG